MLRKLVAGLLVFLLLAAAGSVYALLTIGSPYVSDWLQSAGTCAADSGHAALAETCYRQALSLDACDVDTRIALAALYERQDRFSAAEALLEKGIEVFPAGAELYLALAGLYIRADMPVRAAELLDGAVNSYAALSLSGKRPTVKALPRGGSYTGEIRFTLNAETDTVYYCETDGVWREYAEPIPLEPGSRTVRVIAVRGGVPSRIQSWHYTVSPVVSAFFGTARESVRCPYCGEIFRPH